MGFLVQVREVGCLGEVSGFFSGEGSGFFQVREVVFWFR